MDMAGNSTLADGKSLFKSFSSSIKASPEATAGGVLLAFRPQFTAYASKAEGYLAQQPPLDAATSGQIRGAIALAKDGADQSAKHWASYLNRVDVWLQTGSVNGGSGGFSFSGKGLWIVLALIVLVMVMGRRK